MRWPFLQTRRLVFVGAVLPMLITSGGTDALAQETVGVGPERPWEVILYLGRPGGGPAEELEEAMRASGWADTIPGTSRQANPRSTDPELSLAFSVRRSLGPRLTVELMTSRATTGSTTGFRDEFIGRFLFIDHSVTTIAP